MQEHIIARIENYCTQLPETLMATSTFDQPSATLTAQTQVVPDLTTQTQADEAGLDDVWDGRAISFMPPPKEPWSVQLHTIIDQGDGQLLKGGNVYVAGPPRTIS